MLNTACTAPSGILAEIHKQNLARKERLGGASNVTPSAQLAQFRQQLAEAGQAIVAAKAELQQSNDAIARAQAELAVIKYGKREAAISLLRGLIDDPPPGFNVPVNLIIRLTAEHWNESTVDLLSERKKQPHVWHRQLAMYLCKRLTHNSFPVIGRLFGGRDHTTVLHAVRKVEARLMFDLELQIDIAEILAAIEVQLAEKVSA